MKILHLLIITLSAGLIAAGCASVPTRALPPLKIQTATLEELTAKINASSEALRSIKSTLEIRVLEPSMQGARECQGLLAYEKPDRLYLKGYRPLIPTFFTLVSRNGEFWVHIPRDNTVLTGKVSDLNASENLELGIRPDDLLRTLNIQLIPPSTTHAAEIQEFPDKYLISVFRIEGVDKFMERQIWVERFFLNVEKEVYFNTYGIVELDITRTDYQGEGTNSFPRNIVIFRPERNSTIFLKTLKFEMNPVLKPALFDFKMPGGATVETLKKE